MNWPFPANDGELATQLAHQTVKQAVGQLVLDENFLLFKVRPRRLLALQLPDEYPVDLVLPLLCPLDDEPVPRVGRLETEVSKPHARDGRLELVESLWDEPRAMGDELGFHVRGALGDVVRCETFDSGFFGQVKEHLDVATADDGVRVVCELTRAEERIGRVERGEVSFGLVGGEEDLCCLVEVGFVLFFEHGDGLGKESEPINSRHLAACDVCHSENLHS